MSLSESVERLRRVFSPRVDVVVYSVVELKNGGSCYAWVVPYSNNPEEPFDVNKIRKLNLSNSNVDEFFRHEYLDLESGQVISVNPFGIKILRDEELYKKNISPKNIQFAFREWVYNNEESIKSKVPTFTPSLPFEKLF